MNALHHLRPVLCVRLLAMLSLSLLALECWGMGITVFDPANYAETAVTAANSIRQTAQMVQSYLLQVQQYIIELQNLQKFPQTTFNQTLNSYSSELSTAQSLSQSLTTLLIQQNGAQSTFNTQFRQMAAMGVTPSDYMSREMQVAQYRGQSLQTVFQGQVAALQGVNDAYARVLLLQEQIPASSGLQQSFQTVNQHLNLMAGQNAQLIALMAGSQANATAKAQDEASANQMAGEIIQQRRQEDAAKVQQLHQQLQGQESTLGWGIMSTGR